MKQASHAIVIEKQHRIGVQDESDRAYRDMCLLYLNIYGSKVCLHPISSRMIIIKLALLCDCFYNIQDNLLQGRNEEVHPPMAQD